MKWDVSDLLGQTLVLLPPPEEMLDVQVILSEPEFSHSEGISRDFTNVDNGCKAMSTRSGTQ